MSIKIYNAWETTEPMPVLEKRYGWAALTDAIAEEIARRVKGRKVIDLGCGRGELLSLLHDMGASQVIGLDPELPPHIHRGAASWLDRSVKTYRLTYAELPDGDWSDFVAVVSWPTMATKAMADLVSILPKFDLVLVLAKTTDGTMCGSPALWEQLIRWECVAHVPARTNDLLVYNPKGKNLRARLTLTEYAGLHQDVAEPFFYDAPPFS